MSFPCLQINHKVSIIVKVDSPNVYRLARVIIVVTDHYPIAEIFQIKTGGKTDTTVNDCLL